jgi:hypothetical protein
MQLETAGRCLAGTPTENPESESVIPAWRFLEASRSHLTGSGFGPARRTKYAVSAGLAKPSSSTLAISARLGRKSYRIGVVRKGSLPPIPMVQMDQYFAVSIKLRTLLYLPDISLRMRPPKM